MKLDKRHGPQEVDGFWDLCNMLNNGSQALILKGSNYILGFQWCVDLMTFFQEEIEIFY
jgi:hypothetical protein